jgi:hypothetical protein
VHLTPEQKIIAQMDALAAQSNKIAEKYNALKQQLDNIGFLSQLAVGVAVRAKFGRAEKAREVTGAIVAIDDSGKTTRYKLQIGSGFDIEFIVVTANEILGQAAPAA